MDSYMPSDRGVGILKQLDDIAVAAEEFMARPFGVFSHRR